MIIRNPSSFRDRSGFIFSKDYKIYRQVNLVYRSQYLTLKESLLYQYLTENNLLISHREINENLTGDPGYFMNLEPEQLSNISYPYEWCFTQLKEAALLTLKIMESSIEKGMLLKDATPYNVQFVNGKALWIDSLSFEIYDETKPWVAYYQFCETFLYPLLLDHYGVQEVHRSFQAYPDGIPAENVVKLLPKKYSYNLFNYLHIYLVKKFKTRKTPEAANQSYTYSKIKMQRLLSHLGDRIARLKPKRGKTAWNNYYTETILSEDYLNRKKQLLENWSGEIKGKQVLDIGCNDGCFSLLIAKDRQQVVATDFDAACIENLFHTISKNKIFNILPLCVDMLFPAPAQGFFHSERPGFFERVRPDTVLMLAVIHHLVLTKNLSFQLLAGKLAGICTEAIIEFIPREDEKVKMLLTNKEDVFTDYTEGELEKQFGEYFVIYKKEKIEPTGRVLYFFKR